MPISYTIDHDLGVVFRTFTGDITLEVLAQHYKELLSDTNTAEIMTWVTDMRGCTLSVRGDDIRELVWQHIEPRMKGRRWHCATIVDTGVQYGAANQFAVYSSECGETRLFYDQREAIEWAAQLVGVEK